MPRCINCKQKIKTNKHQSVVTCQCGVEYSKELIKEYWQRWLTWQYLMHSRKFKLIECGDYKLIEVWSDDIPKIIRMISKY